MLQLLILPHLQLLLFSHFSHIIFVLRLYDFFSTQQRKKLPCSCLKKNVEYWFARHISALTAISHVLTKSTTFRGYNLPEGCLVCANVYQSHVDPAIWKDPLVFNPDRWLDENNKLKTNPAFMSFGVGKSSIYVMAFWDEFFKTF